MSKVNIRKGDQVEVVSGKEKGKRGKVLKSMPDSQRVIVEGLHLMKKNMRPTQKNPQGGIVTKEASVNVSNVQLVCSSCGETSRVRRRRVEGGVVRVCGKCAADIDKE